MKKTFTTLALAAGGWLAAAPATAAITLAFTPSVAHINVGDAVTVQAIISGLDAEIVSGFDLNFVYNPSVLAFSSYTYATGPLGLQTALNSVIAAGDLGFDVVSLEDDATLALNQANSFELFSFVLLGAADGTSHFTLGADPDFERVISGLNFSPLTVDVGNLCISVGSGTCIIPEPGTYSLAGLALAGALLPAALRRRRRA